uniref:Swi1p n=1 Tax=Ganoderma boninense TaxID=34458 RepID=A0A5K1K0U4_9APHY|nr:Swi1p [Ganoderma boninense]
MMVPPACLLEHIPPVLFRSQSSIQASGQRKQVFRRFQLEHPQLGNTRNIPLHNNTRWGSADGMLNVSLDLQDPITSFVEHTDAKFGPITTLRPKGGPAREILWSTFKLKKHDWTHVRLCAEIIGDANDYQQICSSTQSPTLHQVIPVLESLATCWEAKAKNPKFEVFHDALKKGLAKINKYYKKLDNTDVYILALLLHPYYKLDYIESEWGGQAEYKADIAAGELNPTNWTVHARSITEKAMKHYWPLCFGCLTAAAANEEPDAASASSNTRQDEYDRARAAHLRNAHAEDGWKTELRRYLDDPMADVKKDINTVEWWWKHQKVFLTLACMAVDILAIPAASRACLDPELFEQIECLKYRWRGTIDDLAAANEAEIERIEMGEFENMEKVEELYRQAVSESDYESAE